MSDQRSSDDFAFWFLLAMLMLTALGCSSVGIRTIGHQPITVIVGQPQPTPKPSPAPSPAPSPEPSATPAHYQFDEPFDTPVQHIARRVK